MSIIFSFRKGKIGIMKNFMHSTEVLAPAMNTLQNNRFKIEYKLRFYDQGKLMPEKTQYVSSLSQAFKQ